MDDARFESWWQAVARPQLLQHFLAARHEAEIKQGAKAAWDAALAWKREQDGQPRG